MSPPCFDRKTKTDCKERTPECRASCPKFAVYYEKKLKEYEDNLRAGEHVFILRDYEKQSILRNKRRKN